MATLWINTIKYYRLAIEKFLPTLKQLRDKNIDEKIKTDLDNQIEMYEDVANKIDRLNLNLEDPNTFFDNEPDEFDLGLDEKHIETFSRLTLRLLEEWKKEKKDIESKNYITEQNKIKFHKLKELIWPLEAEFDNQSMQFSKHKEKGVLKFPGEQNAPAAQIQNFGSASVINVLFSENLIQKIPKDLQELCEEVNFNYRNHKPNACILTLRRILPLSIVRKFQKLDKESEIIKNGEYLDTKSLVGKIEKVLKTKRLYQEIMNYKLLLDSSQHSFTLTADITDVEGAGIKIRLLLEDLFAEIE